MDGFPYVCPVTVRWRDLDPLGHVNNAVLVSFLELARVCVWRDRLGLRGSGDVQFVIARIEVDYARPILLTDRVEVGLRVERIGTSSFDIAYRVEAAGALAASARSVQVHIDPATGRPRELAPALRQSLAGLREETLVSGGAAE